MLTNNGSGFAAIAPTVVNFSALKQPTITVAASQASESSAKLSSPDLLQMLDVKLHFQMGVGETLKSRTHMARAGAAR
jgi:hypothetical protein